MKTKSKGLGQAGGLLWQPVMRTSSADPIAQLGDPELGTSWAEWLDDDHFAELYARFRQDHELGGFVSPWSYMLRREQQLRRGN